MNKIISLLMILMFVACSQDPLDGLSENIRNGKPEGSQKPGEGLGRHIFVLEPPEDLTFIVGEEKEIRINTRIVTVDLPYEVSMHSLPDGASYDPISSTFTWTANSEVINGDKKYALWPIEVEMVTTEEPIIKSRETLNILVVRDLNYVPEIVDVGPIDDMKEGEKQDFEVHIIDKIATKKSPPVLNAVPFDRKKDISGYINVSKPRRDSANKNLWKYDLEIDLVNAEVTNSSDNFHIGLLVRSQQTGSVAMKNYSLNISTKLKQPAITWLKMDVPEFTNNIRQKYSFHIHALPGSDGSSDGFLTKVEFDNDCSTLAGTAKCECKVTDAFSRAVCSIDYLPQIGEEAQEFNFTLVSTMQNDNDIRKDQFFRKIKVLP